MAARQTPRSLSPLTHQAYAGQLWILFFATLAVSTLTTLAADPRCQPLTYSLFKVCSPYAGKPITNATIAKECCTLSMEANAALCYCDSLLVNAGSALGGNLSSVASGLSDDCGVPKQDVHVFNITGCGPTASGEALHRRGLLGTAVVVLASALAAFLLSNLDSSF